MKHIICVVLIAFTLTFSQFIHISFAEGVGNSGSESSQSNSPGMKNIMDECTKKTDYFDRINCEKSTFWKGVAIIIGILLFFSFLGSNGGWLGWVAIVLLIFALIGVIFMVYVFLRFIIRMIKKTSAKNEELK